MATIRVDFGSGFEGDTVVASANGREARADGVTSDLRTGLAESVELDVPDGVVELRLSVPTRGAEATLPVAAEGVAFVRADLVEGELRAAPVADEPFYL